VITAARSEMLSRRPPNSRGQRASRLESCTRFLDDGRIEFGTKIVERGLPSHRAQSHEGAHPRSCRGDGRL